MTSRAQLIAAIDVGTNSFHLVIASVNNRGILHVNSREKEVVRLGKSIEGRDMKIIFPDAIERGVRTLKHFAALAKSQNAEIRAVATSAVREAENQKVFLDKVRNEAGIEIEVVSGIEEGRLIYIGAIHALPILDKKSLIIDIGGGSTETIIGFKGNILYGKSEKLGAIRLTNHFFPDDGITEEKIIRCRNYIHGEWAPIMKSLKETGFEIVVGTSGTILNIAAMTLSKNDGFVPDIINGLSVSKRDILNVIKKIIKARTIEERNKIIGIDPGRTDIIFGGALILEYILSELNIERILISSYALREGIVFDTVQKKKAIQEFKHLSHLRFESVNSLCQRFNVNTIHAEHVKSISIELFDDLQPVHKLGYQYRELLEIASMLHDIGYFISHDQHHKHSHYIISQSIMPGFTMNEAEIIAMIARYHRKSHPKKKHPEFMRLSPINKDAVKCLAGILRIAEGLDRRQQQLVKTVKAEFDDKIINIKILSTSKSLLPDIELWESERRKLLLEDTLKRNISFVIESN
ncbi:MAG: Ppx/GppA family phosphatase [Ignavibacteriae bacterium]|nr:Ppx/GppA family phosphatase [Ignavibacteriota bacterium]